MTDSNETPASASKLPNYIAHVGRVRGGKKRLDAVGAAWMHKNGEGLNVEVDLITHTLTLVLLPPKAKA